MTLAMILLGVGLVFIMAEVLIPSLGLLGGLGDHRLDRQRRRRLAGVARARAELPLGRGRARAGCDHDGAQALT